MSGSAAMSMNTIELTPITTTPAVAIRVAVFALIAMWAIAYMNRAAERGSGLPNRCV